METQFQVGLCVGFMLIYLSNVSALTVLKNYPEKNENFTITSAAAGANFNWLKDGSQLTICFVGPQQCTPNQVDNMFFTVDAGTSVSTISIYEARQSTNGGEYSSTVTGETPVSITVCTPVTASDITVIQSGLDIESKVPCVYPPENITVMFDVQGQQVNFVAEAKMSIENGDSCEDPEKTVKAVYTINSSYAGLSLIVTPVVIHVLLNQQTNGTAKDITIPKITTSTTEVTATEERTLFSTTTEKTSQTSFTTLDNKVINVSTTQYNTTEEPPQQQTSTFSLDSQVTDVSTTQHNATESSPNLRSGIYNTKICKGLSDDLCFLIFLLVALVSFIVAIFAFVLILCCTGGISCSIRSTSSIRRQETTSNENTLPKDDSFRFRTAGDKQPKQSANIDRYTNRSGFVFYRGQPSMVVNKPIGHPMSYRQSPYQRRDGYYGYDYYGNRLERMHVTNPRGPDVSHKPQNFAYYAGTSHFPNISYIYSEY